MSASEKSFGSLVKQYIQKHELTYQDLVDQLGYKSKTSVVRILRDATSYDLRLQFWERFSACYALTAQEHQDFEMLLSLSRMDKSRKSLFLAYRQLFFSKPADTPVHIISPLSDEPEFSLESLLRQRCLLSRKLSIYLFGWVSSAAVRVVYRTLDEMNVDFTISHFVDPDNEADRLFTHLSSAVSMLFDSRCMIYHLPKSEEAFFAGQMMLIRYETSGTSCESDLFLQLDSTHLICQTQTGDHLLHSLKEIIRRNGARPIKNRLSLADDLARAESYLHVQQAMLSAERSHAVYSCCRDLDVSLIPPHIFQSALSVSYLPEREAGRISRELSQVQQKRCDHLNSSRNPCYYILDRDSLKNFLWTGRLKLHPSILRTFTSRERTEILHSLLSMASSNPFVHIRLASDSMPTLWNHISFHCCHRMSRASTHSGHSQSEVLLLQPAVLDENEHSLMTISSPSAIEAYVSFFMSEIWEPFALDKKRSMDVMQVMVQHYYGQNT